MVLPQLDSIPLLGQNMLSQQQDSPHEHRNRKKLRDVRMVAVTRKSRLTTQVGWLNDARENKSAEGNEQDISA